MRKNGKGNRENFFGTVFGVNCSCIFACETIIRCSFFLYYPFPNFVRIEHYGGFLSWQFWCKEIEWPSVTQRLRKVHKYSARKLVNIYLLTIRDMVVCPKASAIFTLSRNSDLSTHPDCFVYMWANKIDSQPWSFLWNIFFSGETLEDIFVMCKPCTSRRF